MKDHYFLLLNGETQNFPKITDFLLDTILNALKRYSKYDLKISSYK